VPALQGVHSLLPLKFENVPASQGRHAAGEDDPRIELLEPGGQRVHELRAAEFPNEPTGHAIHAVDEFLPVVGL
jgi:hypothetical protein